jgi:hypothetical protein
MAASLLLVVQGAAARAGLQVEMLLLTGQMGLAAVAAEVQAVLLVTAARAYSLFAI